MGFGRHKPDTEPEPDIPDELQQQIDADDGVTAPVESSLPIPAPTAHDDHGTRQPLLPDDEPEALPSTLPPPANPRSEEHTSELQSLMRISYAVFCLKKKTDIQSPQCIQDT